MLDNAIAAGIVPVAVAILISGIDDILLDLVCLAAWIRNKWKAPTLPPSTLEEKRIAIFVPCWHEAQVIGQMLEHNVSAIRYRAYDFFIGAYPNDQPTLDAVLELEARFGRVHLAVCPHEGPTSKADCLNRIYQRMLLFEEDQERPFEVVLIHDAEDLIHPESLRVINAHIESHDMVQIPVLPLPTPFWKLTHGIYCDEFAELQLKDMRARGWTGSFIPSCGVGTGYSRKALEKLAEVASNRIFEPSCLTEDYENGIRLHQLGCRQIFIPPALGPSGFVATREYFPSTISSAIRQRTRWVTGIALQTWQRHGWRGRPAMLYWFWRDRKGLLGNPLSLATNFFFVLGLITWIYSRCTGQPWGITRHPLHSSLLACSLVPQVIHLTVRMACVQRVYGGLFALGVPLRAVWANYINGIASIRAMYRYAGARFRHEPLIWVKTEHAYPSRETLFAHKRHLSEILVGSGYVDEAILATARVNKPAGMRMGEYLVRLGAITDEELYEALSLQQSVPSGRVEVSELDANLARALPRDVMERWSVLPYRLQEGNLFLASPEIPCDELNHELRGYTKMSIRFRLVTPRNFQELTGALHS